MTEFAKLIREIENGSVESVDRLFSAVYQELRKLAAAKLSHERKGITLAATGLVHEAYMRLVNNQTFDSKRHFFAAAAEAMRRILVDRARKKNAEKRGGGIKRMELNFDPVTPEFDTDEKLDMLDLALSKLAETEPEKCELVKLRYFAGLKIRQAAEILGISTATADRYWSFTKAWLQAELSSKSVN